MNKEEIYKQLEMKLQEQKTVLQRMEALGDDPSDENLQGRFDALEQEVTELKQQIVGMENKEQAEQERAKKQKEIDSMIALIRSPSTDKVQVQYQEDGVDTEDKEDPTRTKKVPKAIENRSQELLEQYLRAQIDTPTYQAERRKLEQRLVSVTGQGGAVVFPNALYPVVERQLAAASVAFGICKVMNFGSGAITRYPVRTPYEAAKKRARRGDDTAVNQDDVFVQKNLVWNEYVEAFHLDHALIQDTNVDIMAEVADQMSTGLSMKLDADLLDANDGILKDITKTITTAANSTVTYKELVQTKEGPPSQYTKNGRGTWLMNQTTKAELSALTDNANRPLLSYPIENQITERLMGLTLFDSPEMEDFAADKKIVIFGNFAQYCMVAVASGVEMNVDSTSDSVFRKGIVSYAARMRVAFLITNPTAFAVLKLAA